MVGRQLTVVVLLLLVCPAINGQRFGQRRGGSRRGGRNGRGRSGGSSTNSFGQDCGGGSRHDPTNLVTTTNGWRPTTTTMATATTEGVSSSPAINTASSISTAAFESSPPTPATLSTSSIPGKDTPSSTMMGRTASTTITRTSQAATPTKATITSSLPTDLKISTRKDLTTTVERSTRSIMSTSTSSIGTTNHSFETMLDDTTYNLNKQTTWSSVSHAYPTTISSEPDISTRNISRFFRPWKRVKNQAVIAGAGLAGMVVVLLLAAILGMYCCHKSNQERAQVGAHDIKLEEEVKLPYDSNEIDKKKGAMENGVFQASAPPLTSNQQLAPPSYSTLSLREDPPKYCWNQADPTNELKDQISYY